jgi:hydroxyethylthiazole kinase-like uncharacterized protein yjeF
MRYAVSALEMAELERQTVEELGLSTRILMELAGRAIAETAMRRVKPQGRVIVACGPGNNGGDGYVAARWLANRGYRVEVFVFAERGRLKGDAKATFAAVEKLDVKTPVTFVEDARALYDFSSALVGCDLLIDALLGTGATGDVRGHIANAIDVINDNPCPVLAVDIPSGVNADTGAVISRAIEATWTVTFGFAKRGHYLFPGAQNAGDLEIVDIGIPESLARKFGVVGRVIDVSDGPSLVRERPAAANKGSFGRVVAVAGSHTSPGAGLLALNGALRAGAGLVTWATDEKTVEHAQALFPELMLRFRGDHETDAWVDAICEGASALVVGPGLGQDDKATALVLALLSGTELPMCLDADGLNILAKNPTAWERVRAPLVLTPHPKEMSRLVGASVDEVQRDRVAMALQLSVARQCTVVLKGAGTVIADAEGAVTIVKGGNAGMAVGGTGDVLAGIIGAYLASGMSGAEAAQAGVLLHACAGDAAARAHGEAGMRPTDLVAAMGEVFVAWKR